MQLDFLTAPSGNGGPTKDVLRVGSQAVPIHFARNHRARRYIIRVQQDGSVRATVPRVGSIKEARAFAERNADWIAKQLQKRREHPVHPQTWQHGSTILYRGEDVQLIVSPNHDGNIVRFADQTVPVQNPANLRPAIERHLRKLAVPELTTRTQDLAVVHGLSIKHVTIRNQRSRWGSCSRRGAISLNWRLIQMPDSVRDYILLHELAHAKEHNHSPRFWRLVEQLCPNYKDAKVWIRTHRGILR
jgi:predicted metal-dependent hydrolase